LFPLLILLALVGVAGISGCNSGGGDAAPAPTTGTASGVLVIPPNNAVESEPNNAIAQAQAVSSSQTIAGSAAQTDTGFVIPGAGGAEAEDLYSLTATGSVRITLTIAADDLSANDIDLVLMDSAGNVLDASEGYVGTEDIETGGAGDFVIGIRAVQGASAYVLTTSSLGSLASVSSEIAPAGAEFVPGEIIVKRKDVPGGIRHKSVPTVAGAALTHQQSFPDGVDLVKVIPPQQPLQKAGGPAKLNVPGSADNAMRALTIDTIKKLRVDPSIEYAEPNFIRRASAVPNDQFYGYQWHYQLMNLPQAWDVTTGSNSVIVAVIDTGVLTNHPDLNARLLSGYDFISDSAMALDGDGIDADATDVGDDPQGASSSFHGTHVAGTIGAVTDNSTGVAGVTWQGWVMPLRVLGRGGGTDADIAQAIRYAAGLSNNSGTVPAQRAHVINLSLGGYGSNQTVLNAVSAARAQGVIVVAAAGNDNRSAPSYPASYDGVISVSAVGITAQKAAYSNYGAFIDVAAPGGDTSDFNGDGFPDWVLSAKGDDAGNALYRFDAGTSMASPHVAGVIALMLAVNPNLTPTDIDQLIAGTHPDTTRRITHDLGITGRDDWYGHGLLDAAQAVIAAGEVPGGAGTQPAGSILAVSTPTLDFANFLTGLQFVVSNAGVGTLSVTSITDDAAWLTISPSSGTTPLAVIAAVDRSSLSAGTYTATITVTSNASQGSQTATIDVQMAVGGATSGDVGTVYVLTVDQNTLDTVDQVEATAANGYAFSTSALTGGTYLVVAGTDRDNDGTICDIEDACGFYPDLVTIAAGQTTLNVSFLMGELSSPQSMGGVFSQLRDRTFRRLY
jgi:serine protease